MDSLTTETVQVETPQPATAPTPIEKKPAPQPTTLAQVSSK